MEMGASGWKHEVELGTQPWTFGPFINIRIWRIEPGHRLGQDSYLPGRVRSVLCRDGSQNALEGYS